MINYYKNNLELRITKWRIISIKHLKNGNAYELLEESEYFSPTFDFTEKKKWLYAVFYDEAFVFLSNELGANDEIKIGKPLYLIEDRYHRILALSSVQKTTLILKDHVTLNKDNKKELTPRFGENQKYLLEKYGIRFDELKMDLQKDVASRKLLV